MMKILTVLGARPQFVKAAMVSRAIAARPALDEVRVDSGQHYDANLNHVFFEELGIPLCHHSLGVGSAPHGVQTGRMMVELEPIMEREAPDWVLVYGDTNSTLAGALVAAKLQLPLAHVEAGLRSFNRNMPEEINRILTDHVSDILFVPTANAHDNLRREGISDERIAMVGDVMQDAAMWFTGLAARRSRVLQRLSLEPDGYILATVHRAENVDAPERLRAILSGFDEVARALPIIVPLHPRTRKNIERLDLAVSAAVRFIDPVGYLEMIVLERNAALIVTDSGGVQKEAYVHRVPCLTLRDETEWVELVEAGWNRLCSPSSGRAVATAIRHSLDLDPPDDAGGLYGGGTASEKIAECLERSRLSANTVAVA